MNIAILGCGWLGMPLALKLIEEGHIVKGSTTRQEKITDLSNAGIIPYEIKLFEEGIQGDLSAFLKDSEILIINIPPGIRKNPSENFIAKMGRLEDFLKDSRVQKVIFVSATSVYQDTSAIPVYNEDDAANGTAINATQLIGVENIFSNNNYKATIVRFGGLFGPGRHPVNYLAGKENVPDPEAPINLIHLHDCIKILLEVINKEAWGITINAVYPGHPTKKDYYSKMAEIKGLVLPQFDESKKSKGKIIESRNLSKILNYKFQDGLYEVK